MPKIKSSCNNEGLLSEPSTQAQLETPTGSGWGRTISVPDRQESLLIGLPIELQVHIISFLKHRDVVRLQQVCTHFHKIIEDNHELAKAWYRQFTSPHQYRLKRALPTKDVKQLTQWLQLFTNDKQFITSLMEHREKTYFPALFYFTQTRLMSECEKFEVDTKATIIHDHGIMSVKTLLNGLYIAVSGQDNMARIYVRQFNESQSEFSWVEKNKISHNKCVEKVRFSNDARRLVTHSFDYTGKICREMNDGSWQKEFTISHKNAIRTIAFCPNNQYLVTASWDGTAKILTLKDDELWEEKDLISLDRSIESAEFSYDGQRLVIACRDNTAKIYGLKNGLWEPEMNITHDSPVLSAFFSCDNRHVVTISKNEKLKLHGLMDNGLWQEKELAFNDDQVKSAIFSRDGHRLLITSEERTETIYDEEDDGWWDNGFGEQVSFKVTIYGEKDDGSWEHEITISHDDQIISAALSRDGRYALTASTDGKAKILCRDDNGSWVVEAIVRHNRGIKSAIFSYDSRHVVTTSSDGTVMIYSLKLGSWHKTAVISHDKEIFTAIFRADSRLVLTACKKTLKIHGLQMDGKWDQKAIISHDATIDYVSHSGHYVIVACSDNKVFVYELRGTNRLIADTE
ncbi:F-box-like domain-containing protein [Endozoicomonas sp. 4G]|uniref:F-box-like domain-containing protein n=1 Tax=Endozoicomonas sp. 4G TaxID=2872754 RepID=UPI002078F40E|nr:F-box-like domain-containing protein [Endozoicomonas sp. 4G]